MVSVFNSFLCALISATVLIYWYLWFTTHLSPLTCLVTPIVLLCKQNQPKILYSFAGNVLLWINLSPPYFSGKISTVNASSCSNALVLKVMKCETKGFLYQVFDEGNVHWSPKLWRDLSPLFQWRIKKSFAYKHLAAPL